MTLRGSIERSSRVCLLSQDSARKLKFIIRWGDEHWPHTSGGAHYKSQDVGGQPVQEQVAAAFKLSASLELPVTATISWITLQINTQAVDEHRHSNVGHWYSNRHRYAHIAIPTFEKLTTSTPFHPSKVRWFVATTQKTDKAQHILHSNWTDCCTTYYRR
jgi:hypothetical protein